MCKKLFLPYKRIFPGEAWYSMDKLLHFSLKNVLVTLMSFDSVSCTYYARHCCRNAGDLAVNKPN